MSYTGEMEKEQITILVGGIEDLDSALEVSKKIYEPSSDEIEKYHNKEDWKNKLENGGVLVLGKVDEKTAGYLIASKVSGEVLSVWNGGVLPEHNIDGIFSNMMEELAVFAKQHGFKKITLETIEKKFPAIYKLVINRGFMEYEKEWVEDIKLGQVEKSRFELSL